MRQAKSNSETYIGANWLARQAGINRGSIHYYAVKMRLRYFKFSGVRYIEKDKAICLLEEYGKKKGRDFTELINEVSSEC